MYKNIVKPFLLMATFMFTFTFCSKEEEGVTHFTSKVEVAGSHAEEDLYSMTLRFSTDGGETFVDHPVLKIGQTYMVKVFNLHTESDVTTTNCYSVDWSESMPAPTDIDEDGTATFVISEYNALVAAVSDYVKPFTGAEWAGTISAYEDYGSLHWGPYETDLIPDLANPNRFHLDNFYDSGLDAYIEFDPATQTVKFPDQVVGGKAIKNSSGTFDQCRRQFTIELNYDGGDWVYRFGQH